MNDRTIVRHPNGYSGVLMGKSTMMIYDKDDNCILHTCFRTPNTEKELYEVLETMPRFIEILASVEADRKTEPQMWTCPKCGTENHIVYKRCPCCGYEPKDEPQTYVINPQEPTNDDKCFKCDDFFTCGGQCNKVEDEPQTERSER